MQAAELESELDPGNPRARAGRALALIAFSVVAIVVAGTVYILPTISFGTSRLASLGPQLHGDYSVESVDFITPTSGYLVVDFPSGDFAVIRTNDAGTTWTRELTQPRDSHEVYSRFFDDQTGVVALVGGRPVVSRTNDAGMSWDSIPALTPSAIVLSWSFVDSMYGWMLARETAGATPRLFRTEDGGFSWLDLGNPVAPPDEAFQVQFSHFTTGWLSTVSAGPYAYRTQDFGVTWTRVPLLTGAADSSPGQYFVAVRPTEDLGALATVVYFPPPRGRSGYGGIVRAYPPLTVHAYDGGRPHTYLYSTVLDEVSASPFASEPPPNQSELGTMDAGKTWAAITVPGVTGSIGYSDASHWWWVGAGTFAGSSDGGASWTNPRNISALEPVPGSLEVLDRNHALFAGQSGSRPGLEMTADGGRHWTLVPLPPLADSPTLGG